MNYACLGAVGVTAVLTSLHTVGWLSQTLMELDSSSLTNSLGLPSRLLAMIAVYRCPSTNVSHPSWVGLLAIWT